LRRDFKTIRPSTFAAQPLEPLRKQNYNNQAAE